MNKNQQVRKADKTSEEIEFEKAKEELTFHPTINKSNNVKSGENRINQRSVMDNIERMRRAREEREFKKAMTERGYLPGKQQKPLNHGIEKPLSSKKDLAYSRKPAGPHRAPEESTLLQGIHNLKPKKQEEIEQDEPTFHPEINPQSKKLKTKAKSPISHEKKERRSPGERKIHKQFNKT